MLFRSGAVTGQIEPTPSRVDFGVVAGGKDVEKKVNVFAKGTAADLTLSIAEVEPKFLKVRFERDAQHSTHWRLSAVLPAGAPVGQFDGKIVIADDKKVKRLILGVKGIVSGTPSATGKANPSG